MTITDVKTILLTGPCTNDPFLSEARKLRSAAFIRIETTTGHVGLGETYAGYFFPEGVPPIVDFFKTILVGQSIEHIDELWNRMYHCGNFWCRVGLGAIVLAGIEAALWDLKGKIKDVPVYSLLRDVWREKSKCEPETYRFPEKLPCYATGGPSNFPLEKMEQKVGFYIDLGFTGVKIGAGAFYKDRGFEIEKASSEAAAEFEAKKIDFLRHRFGYNLNLMLDAHMGNTIGAAWGVETAISVAKVLEPYQLCFLEEPLHYNNPDGYTQLRQRTKTPIAGGECLTTLAEWEIFIEKNCFNIGQPDASFTAGLIQFINVASLLYDRGCDVAPHAWGAGGSQMQNIHAGFACPNTRILEVAPAYGPLHSEIMVEELTLKSGFLLPPEHPGLGIELTEDVMRRYPFIPGSGEFNSVPGKILTT
ncbi:MAG: mandelate racemase/muconate lactonizing enzyme family protein [Parapedobacter sp.]|nr:MAG: mandelate racemase/muconate lactonizing enzyme family protein [Parapedobacter sp.]